jgi:hypothetical protein
LVQLEGCNFVFARFERILKLAIEALRTAEPLLEVGLGQSPAFLGIELALAGELELAGVVKQDAFFLDVAEEVVTVGQGFVDRLDGFDDQVRPVLSADAGKGQREKGQNVCR